MFNIAIDGPSASGKSSIAKGLAKRLNMIHIDTGAMYRAIAFSCLTNGVSLTNEKLCAEIALESDLSFDQKGRILLNNKDVSKEIRLEKISKAASIISQHKTVRQILVQKQQDMALSKGFVMDGRDITSVVLPNAEVKIFQTADVNIRAERRYYELTDNNVDVDYDEVLTDLKERDYRDMNRESSPLIKVDDAFEIDTSHLTINEVINLIINHIESRNLK